MDRWIRIEQDDTTWEFDTEFLTSEWTCIWNQGCAGIGAIGDVAGQLGCCSVGAEMLDDEEAMRISAVGAALDPERTQFASAIADGGVLVASESDRASWATRVVDGACIFLNRPGFPGGEGCALHLEAIATGEPHIDVKPSICWQLPLKVEHNIDDASTSRLRGWLRRDWGPEGNDMAYCCTERESPLADAFVGEVPVIESLREELEAILGVDLYAQLAERLSAR